MTPQHRYRATIEYDGTDFLGYQVQAIGRTVQGEIEKALKKISETNIRIKGAGRTDAGVHAVGQVIAFNIKWQHSLVDLQRALNANLPRDIVVTNLTIADSNFHPRFSALSRSYRYTIINRPWPSVLHQRYAYHVWKPLDIKAMREASRVLIGSHDFASFGKSPQGDITVRNLMQADWLKEGEHIWLDITANAFLYRMVRNIVGTLVQVGMQYLTVDDVEEILEAKDLTRSASTAPAHGLCLIRVVYSDEPYEELTKEHRSIS